MIKKLFVILIVLIGSFTIKAQVVTIFPTEPLFSDTITITFNAALGDSGLINFNSDVFIYTGVITDQSQSNSDWKFVRGNWGSPTTSELMTKIGTNLYQIKFLYQDFYSFPNSIKIEKLAFLFTNNDGSIAGRGESGNDIFISVSKNNRTYISHTFDGSSLNIKTTQGYFSLSYPLQKVIKVAYFPDSTLKADTGFSVIYKQKLNAVLNTDTSFLYFETPQLKALIKKNPFSISYISGSDTILKEENGFEQNESKTTVRFKVKASENIQGGGSRALDINRNGKRLEIYNTAQYGYSNGAQILNICIPFLVSSSGYGLFFNNFSKSYIDIANSETNILEYGTDTASVSYYIIAGPENDSILERYTHLTGKQPLPPRWALGYIQSKYGYQTESEARNIVNRMLNEGFKLDALVLDLYWFGNPQKMGNLSWDYSKFQQPVKMMKDFDSLGVKTILISETYITQNSTNFSFASSNGFLAKNIDGTTRVINNFWAGSSGLLDVTNPLALNWMWNFYAARNNEGVSGWWTDLGEPENHPDDMYHSLGKAKYVHNIYALLWNEMLYNKHKEFYPETRLFNLSRSGFAGMQRMSTFPWSGDVQRSFSGLQAQIPIMLGMSMSGVSYMHSDLGGFTGGGQNNELYTRWLQLGAFSPVMRAHGEGVPTEPVNYPVLNKNIVKNYINLRHEFLPYNYSIAVENSISGKPITKPMNYFNPSDPILAGINDQYFWGDNIMVAPVVIENQNLRNVIFPSGNWIDYWSLNEYKGGTQRSISAPLNILPFFIRAGSLIPLSVNSTASKFNHNALRFKFYPDEDVINSKLIVYDDDGKKVTNDPSNSMEKIILIASNSNNSLLINFSREANSFIESPGGNRELIFEIQRISTLPTSIKLNNLTLTASSNINDFNLLVDSGYYFDQNNSVLYIKSKIRQQGVILITDLVLGSTEIIAESNGDISISKPYPNPFSSFTTFDYQINKQGKYQLLVIDKYGKLIKEILNNNLLTGKFTNYWYGDDLTGAEVASGAYTLIIKNSKKVLKSYELIKR